MDDEEFARPEASKFNDYLKLFRHFYAPEEGLDIDKRKDKDLPENDTNAINVPLDTVVQDNTNIETEQ